MSDLIKTIDNVDQLDESLNESELIENSRQEDDEDFDTIERNQNFFSGLTGIVGSGSGGSNIKNQNQITQSNESIKESLLKQTKLKIKSKSSTIQQKIDKKLNSVNKKLNALQQQENENDIGQSNHIQTEEKKDLKSKKQQQGQHNEVDKKKLKRQKINKEIQNSQQWSNLGLIKAILKVCQELDYSKPTPIQALTIPAVISGKDVLASSLTGSGKTAAFLIPVLQKYYRSTPVNYIKVLVVTPTRELALQCYEMFHQLNKYTRLTASLVIGAVSMQKQEQELHQNPDIVICTPGRMIDHITNSRSIDLEDLEMLIIDEADKLLDMGFMPYIQQILQFTDNPQRQTLLFSATLGKDLQQLIQMALKKPIRLKANPDNMMAEKLKQQIIRIFDTKQREATLLALVQEQFQDQTIIFFKTKKHCHRMAIIFGLLGYSVSELHGNLSQHQRIEAFENFKEGKFKFLMATDLASRGLDIRCVKAVINFELPQEVTRYIHRVGRTARAGSEGICITICTDDEERKLKKMLKEKMEKIFIDPQQVRKYQQQILKLNKDADQIMMQEHTERQLRKAEMEATKAQNLLDYKDEIFNKPKKNWFQSNRDRNLLKEQCLQEYKKHNNVVSQQDNQDQDSYENYEQTFTKKKKLKSQKANQKSKFY